MEDGERYFFSNKMGRIFLLAMEDVMGENSMQAVLNTARLHERVGHYPPNDFEREYSFEEVGQLSQVLEEMYGAHSGRQLSRRIGRACFQQGITDLSPVLGLADVMFRLLPLRMKLKAGVEVLAQMFNKFSDHHVRLEEDEQYIRWVVERCGICWERTSETPCCQLAVGLLEEGLYWVSGGEQFYVEEVSCLAAGDSTCTLLVGKRPLA